MTAEMALHQMHRSLGAVSTEQYGWQVPLHYGDPTREHRAALEHLTVVDLSFLGHLRLVGKDCLDLLHRLSTNDLLTLTQPGQGAVTVLTTPKGRIVDAPLVGLEQPDRLFLLCGPGNQRKVAQWIDTYLFGEDVALQDLTGQVASLGVIGPHAAAALTTLTGHDVTALPRYHHMRCAIAGVAATVLHGHLAATDSFIVTVPQKGAVRVWQALTSHGATSLGWAALETLRIEAGVPAVPMELSEDFNPWEVRLDEFIDFHKGCYVGQEVVLRLHTYEKVQRVLMGLRFAGNVPPTHGATLLSAEGADAGVVTSAASVPGEERGVGLGVVRLSFAKPGASLAAVSGEQRMTVTLVDLPSASHARAGA